MGKLPKNITTFIKHSVKTNDYLILDRSMKYHKYQKQKYLDFYVIDNCILDLKDFLFLTNFFKNNNEFLIDDPYEERFFKKLQISEETNSLLIPIKIVKNEYFRIFKQPIEILKQEIKKINIQIIKNKETQQISEYSFKLENENLYICINFNFSPEDEIILSFEKCILVRLFTKVLDYNRYTINMIKLNKIHLMEV